MSQQHTAVTFSLQKKTISIWNRWLPLKQCMQSFSHTCILVSQTDFETCKTARKTSRQHGSCFTFVSMLNNYMIVIFHARRLCRIPLDVPNFWSNCIIRPSPIPPLKSIVGLQKDVYFTSSPEKLLKDESHEDHWNAKIREGGAKVDGRAWMEGKAW